MPAHPEVQTLAINDTLIHTQHSGEGRPLLLIHGSVCDYRYWRWQMEALAKGYHVLAPSLRGYWPAPIRDHDPLFSVKQHADDLAVLLDALAPNEQAVILGHSRGAQVAVELAIAQPERIAGLILADPGFRFSDEPETQSLHADTLTLLQQGHSEEALSRFVNSVNGQDIWKVMVSWFKTMVLDNAFTLLSQYSEMNKAVSVSALQQIECPVLLVQGTQSPLRYRSRIERISKLLPMAHVETIPQASHGMNLANPKVFNEHVLNFQRYLPKRG